MIWRDGALPEDAPPFDALLSHDLLAYGYALLEHGLELSDLEGPTDVSRQAFENAAAAIESVIARGEATAELGFHRVVAAASFHLARYSARAYSLLTATRNDQNVSPIERCLVLLMLRDLDTLADLVSGTRADEKATDASLAAELRSTLDPSDTNNDLDGGADVLDVIDTALTDAFMGAISVAMLAFERGEPTLLTGAIARLKIGMRGAAALSMVPQWWCHRLAIHLLGGLWESSFHVVLPTGPGDGDAGDWDRLRATFIASLFRRRRSEIDLWPSQLEAASRVLNTQDNLVLSLPTSAGKTRIAELCILATLAEGKRVVFVTPLRALSAQTETALERTFVPLGKTISSLYGTTGVSDVDESILLERDIVVSTPEKLDFALRNDPDLLNDVGLIVLDEGHMIGANEREVRYEVQIQRLLSRPDAKTRRIICLSAILPEGDEVKDFVDWLTDDESDGLISSDWRPTTLRYGEVVWREDNARLNITVGGEEPYVPRFLTAETVPSKQRKLPFPKDAQELTLATAWRLVDDGQTVLVFCPLKTSVNAFAKLIVKLARQGALRSVFDGDPAVLNTALSTGQEWFGADHPLLACLRMGVAIHHGSLPGPYRREVEKLLQQGELKITISSPTLAQGLNLSASSLVVHSLWRNRKIIDAAEFRNIVGRAGRAFVDSSGLVVHPMFEPTRRARQNWVQLVEDSQLRDMQSGLFRLLAALLQRMSDSLGEVDWAEFTEYVTGLADWSFPVIAIEDDETTSEAMNSWPRQLASLDCAILGLLSDSSVTEANLGAALDAVLASSLWARTIARYQEPVRNALRTGLVARAAVIWQNTTPDQRRGYYLAGVGLATGRELDSHAEHLNRHLQIAEAAIQLGLDEEAIDAITRFARIVLDIFPFTPKSRPDNWEKILVGWLRGRPVAEIAADDSLETAEFIEDTLAYRLPWALEAVRVRATAHPDPDALPWDLSSPETGLSVAAVEAGTLNRAASTLMRAGFASRSGALAAVKSTNAEFSTLGGLHEWMTSDVTQLSARDEAWPTPTTHELWKSFAMRSVASRQRTWVHEVHQSIVTWMPGYQPSFGEPYRALSQANGTTVLETADARQVGVLTVPLSPRRQGLLKVTATSVDDTVELEYRGPSDLFA
ncbi:Helicase conserved C-terminal domain-containing protein [Microbacterium azadirachtae]|uniref:Helicase conserved C-terminal domain-containing protein n=2 Tax=Microbacterium azadirachtae TaxID=582680 RepID=A0A1I6G4X0_9MICO|nr:Helicase conserved C-terminal domain-containing protein [Microbacterium azadirachtae]SEF64610.1 Helicase conserved C-terminal domain-containing protein [Microbacterium azadirachtae]SEF65490.1 Helicase conserved C-terminal domain-containing protein [Microbacterium azadirachtae]SFR37212.1 Helicase conserved C-terminal domain-containing protein [Microbacterium azadirachtae]